MKLEFDRSFEKAYKNLPVSIRRKVDRVLILFLKDFHHPSLHTKKMEGRESIFELRVDHSYRITFKIIRDVYRLRKVGSHDILRNP